MPSSPRSRPFAPRLVVVTSGGLVPGRGHLDVARAAVAGGADCVQLRAPDLPPEPLTALAREVAAICRAGGVPLIVNNRPEVARAAGADGAHVGQGDQPEEARAALGPDLVLGVSVDTPEQARRAEEFGADYLGVVVWPTATKPEAVARGLEGLRAVAEATRLPVVGIGGVDAQNAGRVIAAGAAGVAVVSAVGVAADMEAATAELRAAVEAAHAGGEKRDQGAEGATG